jgi:trimeric autotransporter adhesin
VEARVTVNSANPTSNIEPIQPHRRTRRALLAGAAGSVAALVASHLGRPDRVSAAAGDPLILGTANTAGTANTTVATSSSGTALLVTQSGTGTALRGSATGPTSIAGFFTATNGTGVSGVTGRDAAIGVYGANDAPAYGGGAAVRAAGQRNHGLVATAGDSQADAIRAVQTDSGAAIRATALLGVAFEGVGQSGLTVEATGTTTDGVYGLASAATGTATGVRGEVASEDGVGVRGVATATTGNSAAIFGINPSTGGIAVYGRSTSTTGNVYGLFGETSSTTDLAAGAWGMSNATTGAAVGVYGQTLSTGDSAGVLGWAFASTGSAVGVAGLTQSADGTGVLGVGGPSPSIGVMGSATGNGFGVYSQGNAKVAGDLEVTGDVTKAGGSFKIDHPLDPANKFLYHSFVESPDMKNVYDGVATLDGAGEGTVQLPDWIEALNRDFRYQLTPIGQYAPLFVQSKIESGRFKIAGGVAGQQVSWQVTGIRRDAWAEAHRIPVEEAKVGAVKGRYLHPTEHGQPAAKAIKAPAAARRSIPKAPKRPARR